MLSRTRRSSSAPAETIFDYSDRRRASAWAEQDPALRALKLRALELQNTLEITQSSLERSRKNAAAAEKSIGETEKELAAIQAAIAQLGGRA